MYIYDVCKWCDVWLFVCGQLLLAIARVLSRLPSYWVCSLHSYRTYLYSAAARKRAAPVCFLVRCFDRVPKPVAVIGNCNNNNNNNKKLPRICWKFWIKLYIFMRNTAGATDKYFMCSAFNYVSVRTSLDCRWIKEPELYCWFKGQIIFLLVAGNYIFFCAAGEFCGRGAHDYVVGRFNTDMIFNCSLLFAVCFSLVFTYNCAIAFDLNYVGKRISFNVYAALELHSLSFIWKW